MQKLEVAFAKSHIISIGEKLYSDSTQLIREIVNNSYDADATEVRIGMSGDGITIVDDGCGMNEAGLGTYFFIGSENKKENPTSPLHKRKVIGQMGIGKISAFAVTDSYTITTNKGEGEGISVTFDKKKWLGKPEDDKTLDFETFDTPEEESGTIVKMTNIKNPMSEPEVLTRLRQSVPIGAKNFKVYLNGKQVKKQSVEGLRFNVSTLTDYGLVEGVIVVSNSKLAPEDQGVECKVNGAMIERSFFGDARTGYESRIWGEVDMSFVPFTTDRNSFITDSKEYKVVRDVMKKGMRNVINLLKSKDTEKRTVEEARAFIKVRNLLKRGLKGCPHLCPERPVLVHPAVNGSTVMSVGTDLNKKPTGEPIIRTESEKTGRTVKKVRVSQTGGSSKILKKLKVDHGITMQLDDGDADGLPSYQEDGIVHINRNHRVYKYLSQDKAVREFYGLQLVLNEAILMSNPIDLKQYQGRCIELLTSCYV